MATICLWQLRLQASLIVIHNIYVHSSRWLYNVNDDHNFHEDDNRRSFLVQVSDGCLVWWGQGRGLPHSNLAQNLDYFKTIPFWGKDAANISLRRDYWKKNISGRHPSCQAPIQRGPLHFNKFSQTMLFMAQQVPVNYCQYLCRCSFIKKKLMQIKSIYMYYQHERSPPLSTLSIWIMYVQCRHQISIVKITLE